MISLSLFIHFSSLKMKYETKPRSSCRFRWLNGFSLQIPSQVLDGRGPGFPGRLQVGAVPSLLGPQEPVSRPLEGVADKRLAQFLHPCRRWPHRGVHACIVLAVETENGRTDRTQRLRQGGRAVIDHGGAKIGLCGCVVKTLAASPAEADNAEFAGCRRQASSVAAYRIQHGHHFRRRHAPHRLDDVVTAGETVGSAATRPFSRQHIRSYGDETLAG